MSWGPIWVREMSRKEWGGLGIAGLADFFSQGGVEPWFWNLGRDSPVLERGSCEGSCLD